MGRQIPLTGRLISDETHTIQILETRTNVYLNRLEWNVLVDGTSQSANGMCVFFIGSVSDEASMYMDGLGDDIHSIIKRLRALPENGQGAMNDKSRE